MRNQNGLSPTAFNLLSSLDAPIQTTYRDQWKARQEELAREQAQSVPIPESEDNDSWYLANQVRGAGAAVTNFAGKIVEGLGALEATRPAGVAPAGVPSYAQNYVASQFENEQKLSPEELQARRQGSFDVATQAADQIKSVDFGYDKSRNSVDKTKELASKGNWLGAALSVPGLLGDQFVQSVPYMLNAPLTAVAVGGDTVRERVENTDGKTLPDDKDVAIGGTVGAISGVLERILPKALFAEGKSLTPEAAKEIAQSATKYAASKIGSETIKNAGIEGVTEAIQTGVLEYVGQRYGTDKAMSLQEAGMQALEAGLIGGGIGGSLGAIKGGIESRHNIKSLGSQRATDSGIDTPVNGEQLHTGVDTSTHIPSVDELGIIDDLPKADPIIHTGDTSNPDDRFKFELNTESFASNVRRALDARKAEQQKQPFANPEYRAELDAPDTDLASAARAYGEQNGLIPPPKDPNVIDYTPSPVAVPSRLSLAPLDASYDNGIDFKKPDRTPELSSKVEKAISANIDLARNARMPENLKDTRLLRDRYRSHLNEVADSIESHAGAFSSPDSLLDAVTKNGGLNSQAWAQEGIDPADAKLVNGEKFQKVFRKDGGMTPDDVAEFAAQRGYSGFTDDKGAPVASAALDAINNELRGNKKYSSADEEKLQAAQSAPKYLTELKEFGSPDAIKRAISQALDGKKLGDNQLRIVQEILDNTNTHRRDDSAIREKWAERSKTMLANRGQKALDDWRNRDEHLPGATTHEAALNEIMSDAIQHYGIDADAVKAAYDKYSAKYPDMNSLVSAMTSWVSASKPDTSEHLSHGQEKPLRESSGQPGALESGAGLSLESQVRQAPATPRSDAPAAQGESGSNSAGRDAGLRQSVESGTDENQLPPLVDGFEKSLLRARPLAKKLGIPNYNQMRLAELVPAINAKYESRHVNDTSVANIEGKDIDGNWVEFSKDSGTIGIPRAEMPQIKAEHRGAMVNFMNARDIAHQEETVPADTLKPTQKEFSREKVAKAKEFDGGNRSILISSDNHVLDGHHQWMAARDNGEDVKVIRLDAPIKKLVEVAHEFPSSTVDDATESSKSSSKSAIQDLGEKIGGARKDNAQSPTKKATRKTEDSDKPAWARRYVVAQNVDLPGVPNAGKWTVLDKQKKDFRGGYAPAVRNYFDSEDDANAAIPLIAVSRNHSVRSAGNGKYEIWRTVNDHKRVKVVSEQFDTRESAALYLAAHAEEIIETNTTFGEANIPAPPDRERKGVQHRKGDVDGNDFMKTFGFRGVEFGNWNNQDDRQALLNDAFDGLLDLASVLNIPPKAISLNGDLALAFGARGQGLVSAKAHYERYKAVINLTKENGAGSLAHEWFHALDHYLARQDGKASSEWTTDEDGTKSLGVKKRDGDYASHGFKIHNSGVRDVIRDAYTKLIKTMYKKAETYVEDTKRADEFTGRARKDLEFRLTELRNDLSEQKDPKYWRRNNKPASAEQLAEFDAVVNRLLDGDDLATEARKVEGGKSSWPYRMSNDSLEKLSEIYKSVRGRSGFGSSQSVGVLDRVRAAMSSYDSRLKMLADAKSGSEKVKSVLTDFAMDAKELDQGRGSDYWTTPHEMAARAFQGYVEDKIAEQGGVSRFLNYGPENAGILTPWGFKRPFPAGQERVAINKAFDEFIGALETKETDKGVLLYKLDTKNAKAISKESAQAIIDRISKNWKVKVKINLIGSINELPESVKSRLHKADDEQAEPAALIDESTGHVYINLARAEDERTIEQLIFHEVYTHFGLRQLMGPSVSGLMTRMYLNLGQEEFNRLAEKYGVNVEAYEKAYDGMPAEYRQAILAEELLAHMAEHHKPSIVRLAHEFMGAVRAWLRTNGFFELAKTSESDMRYLLKQARETVTRGKHGDVTGLVYSLAGLSKSERKQINAARSQSPEDEIDDAAGRDEDLISMWAAISRNEDSFQLPHSSKKDFVEIAQDLEGFNGFKTYEADELALMNKHKAERAWRVVTPKGEKAAVFERGDKVWIDVSDLSAGEDGKRVYNMVANYALNNGKVFMGDPAGLSITAKSRRLENMLSSALKFGTTDHLQPHRLQLTTSHGVPGLKWKKGDTENNILEMIKSSYETVKNQFPEIDNLVYNPKSDQFQHRDSGKEVTNADLDNIARSARRKYSRLSAENERAASTNSQSDSRTSQEIGRGGIDSSSVSGSSIEAGGVRNLGGERVAPTAGRATLERAILTGSILRGTRGERSAILAKLGSQRSERLSGILYSLGKSETRSQGGFSFGRKEKTSSLPPSLQESFSRLGQKKTLAARIKTEVKRQLTPAGLLPKEIFELKVARDGEINANELHTRHTLQGFYDAIDSAYGMPYKSLKAGTKREINKVLRGEENAQLAPSVIKALGVMRDDIKKLSQVYVQQLAADAVELKQQGKDAEAAAKLATIETISSNFDTYLHRSYRAFDDKDWPTKVPEQVYQNAVNFFANEYADGGKVTAENIKLAEKRVHMILHEGTAFDSIGTFIAESKLGSKDMSIMKKRKEVPEPIRALLGEYEDAAMNYTKSVTKMSRLVHNHAFLTGMKSAAFDLGLLHEKQNLELDATKPIAAEGSEAYAPLNGLYTTREFEQALKDAMGKTNPNAIYDAMVAFNGMVKFGKTVLSPTTAWRNFWSSLFFTFTNGHFDLSQAKKSFKSAQVYFTDRGEVGVKEYMEKLRKLGVIYDSPYAGEMMDLLKDARLEQTLMNGGNPWLDATKSTLEWAQKFYSFGDDFYKIIGFENEKAMLIKHKKLSESDAEKEAAERIRNTYPTYSMIGKGVNTLRRFPLVGTFVSFPAEIIRTSYHITNYLYRDAKELGIKNPMVQRKLIGYAIAAGVISGMSALSAAWFDVGDDEEKALRSMAPDWTKNSNILWLGRDEDGNRRYVDLSFLDPYGYWKRPINAVLQDQPLGEALASGATDLLSPFFGLDITAKAIGEALFNDKVDGGKIYNELDSTESIAGDIATHLRKALQPGVATNIERFILASQDAKSKTGKAYDTKEEIAALFGWRAGTFDPKVALYYQAYEYQDKKAAAAKLLSNVATDINSVDDDELRDAYLQSITARRDAFRDMQVIVAAGRAAGLTNPELTATLRNSGVSILDARALVSGKEPVITSSKTVMKSAIKKAAALFDAETQAEFKRREKYINDLRKQGAAGLLESAQAE